MGAAWYRQAANFSSDGLPSSPSVWIVVCILHSPSAVLATSSYCVNFKDNRRWFIPFNHIDQGQRVAAPLAAIASSGH